MVIILAVRQVRTCDVSAEHGDAEQYVFGSGSEFFVADLCEADADKLDKALEPYIKIGVPVSVRELMRNGAGNGYDTAAVRTWLNAHGRPQADRGRISADDRAFYLKEVQAT